MAAQPSGQRGVLYMGLCGLLSALMLGVWVAGRGLGAAAERRVVVCGLAAMVLLLAAPPFTSHDAERYLWDGHVALSGADPYRLSPAEVASRLPAWPLPRDNTTYPTLYPPGALALFATAAAFGPAAAPWAWKLLVVGGAMALVLWTALLLRSRDAAHHLPLVALSPLLVLEAGVGAHLDTLAAAALAGGLVLSERRRWWLAGAALGIGGLLKLLPLIAAGPLALAAGRKGAGRLLAAAVAIFALGYALAIAMGFRPLGSLPVFLAEWRFGSPLFAALAWLDPRAALRAAGLLAAAAFLWIATSAARTDGLRGSRRALAAVLIASPVVFPWYLIPLLPAYAAQPSAMVTGWLLTAPLTYEVIDRFDAGGGWHPAAWPLWCMAFAWVLGSVVDRWRAFRRRDPMAVELRYPFPVSHGGGAPASTPQSRFRTRSRPQVVR